MSPEIVDVQAFCVFIFTLKNADRNVLPRVYSPPAREL